MPWCPNCKEEYREGFDKCTDCGAELVDEMPIDMPSKNAKKKIRQRNMIDDMKFSISMNPCILISSSDQTQVKLIESMLVASNIPFFTKDRGYGPRLRGMMGYTVFGSDIFVDKSHLDEAKELIDIELNELEKDDEVIDDTDNSWVKRRKFILKFIFYVLILFCSLGVLNIIFRVIEYILFRN